MNAPAIQDVGLFNRLQAAAQRNGQSVVWLRHHKLWGLDTADHSQLLATASNLETLAIHINGDK